VECLAGKVRSRLLFIKHALEATQLLLHVLVDFQIAPNDYFHLAHIVVDFIVLRLDVLNQLALLSDHMSYLLQVLQMVHAELFLFLHNVVDLLVERDHGVICTHG